MSLLPIFGWTIRKGRQTNQRNPEFEFGHTQGAILKKPVEKYISIQGGREGGETQKAINFSGKLSFSPVFPSS